MSDDEDIDYLEEGRRLQARLGDLYKGIGLSEEQLKRCLEGSHLLSSEEREQFQRLEKQAREELHLPSNFPSMLDSTFHSPKNKPRKTKTRRAPWFPV